MSRLFFIAGCLFGACFPLHAQDNHYEAMQLGSKNAILSGASLSRWVDQTAVVHNAATMMNAGEPGITINATTGGHEQIHYKDDGGNESNIDINDTQVYLGLIAADVPVFKNPEKNRLGVAIFARVADRTRYTNRVNRMENIINEVDMPGVETYIGQYSLETEVKETTCALGWATRLSDHWSAGLVAAVLIRNQRHRENFNANVLADATQNPVVDLVSSFSDINMKLNFVMLQTKGSLAWQNGPWNLGVVLSAPTLSVWTGGDMVAQQELTNFESAAGGERSNYLVSAYLQERKPVFKYPFSFGVGVSRQLDAVVLSASGTYHGKIERYIMVDPADEPFLQPVAAENRLYTPGFLDVWSSNRPVVNSAVSAAWMLSPKISLMGGFRTDLHYAEDKHPLPEGFQLAKKLWNRYHFNAGAALSGQRARLVFGVQYSLGQVDGFQQRYTLNSPAEENLLKGMPSAGSIRANGITAVVSLLFFMNQVALD
ncbi:MAG: hypothetical protein ACOYNO_04465 [Saprospiraceae bacterium]